MAVEMWPPRLSQTSTIGPSGLLVGGVEQSGEVRFTKALLLTLASRVDHGAVDEPTALPGPLAGQTGQRNAARALRRDFHDRGLAARGPGTGPGWSQR
jgi:hypothetical protein